MLRGNRTAIVTRLADVTTTWRRTVDGFADSAETEEMAETEETEETAETAKTEETEETEEAEEEAAVVRTFEYIT